MMKGNVYVFQLLHLQYGNTMDYIVVDIVGETETHYKVIATSYNNIIELVRKEDVDLIKDK